MRCKKLVSTNPPPLRGSRATPHAKSKRRNATKQDSAQQDKTTTHMKEQNAKQIQISRNSKASQ